MGIDHGRLISAGRAATATARAQLLLGLHEACLRPHAYGAVGADNVAVEHLGQGALDALVDVKEAALLGGDGLQRLLVGDGVEDSGAAAAVGGPAGAARLAVAGPLARRTSRDVIRERGLGAVRGGVGRRDGGGGAAEGRLARTNLLEVGAELSVLLLQKQVLLHGKSVVVRAGHGNGVVWETRRMELVRGRCDDNRDGPSEASRL